jgi:hypothetical protein
MPDVRQTVTGGAQQGLALPPIILGYLGCTRMLKSSLVRRYGIETPV